MKPLIVLFYFSFDACNLDNRALIMAFDCSIFDFIHERIYFIDSLS